MADINNGFTDFAEELQDISNKITDKQIHKKVLMAGAKPIIERAGRIMSHHRRTGKLQAGLTAEYSSKSNSVRIGYGKKGFYGRFHDGGWRPVTGKRQKNGRFKRGTMRPSGKFIRNKHIRPAYEAEKGTVKRVMLETFKKELGG